MHNAPDRTRRSAQDHHFDRSPSRLVHRMQRPGDPTLPRSPRAALNFSIDFVSTDLRYPCELTDCDVPPRTAARVNAERALDALGDRTRRRVFARLRDRTCYAGELAQGMNVTRSAVSQHLQVLKAAGLVLVRAEGARRLYQVDMRGVEALRRWLDGFWDETLGAFKEAAERAQRRQGDDDG
jgi:DNA-binding transcriptional ArsR family regulator